MLKTVKAYEAKHYSVNCKPNDSVDIKCGGPPILGFDFYVDSTKSEKIVITHIKKELKKNNLPLMSIRVVENNRLVKTLWTNKMISEAIKKYSV